MYYFTKDICVFQTVLILKLKVIIFYVSLRETQSLEFLFGPLVVINI